MELIESDSLLIHFIKNNEIIYAAEELVFSVGHYGVDEKQQDNFVNKYAEYKKNYTFLREEKWDNFQVRLAVVEHEEIQYKKVRFGYRNKAGSYQMDQYGIHIKVVESRSYNVAYAFE